VRRAVFIDRDGVICRNRDDHVKSWEEFEFLPGVLRALVRLAQSDLCIIVITNQAIVNRHVVSGAVVNEIHERMAQAIKAAGGRIDRVMCCPHRPDEGCDCRKPKPGLLLEAARELDINLAKSYLVGDAKSDIVAGRTAGCGYLYLVLTGRGARQLIRCWLDRENGFRVAADLRSATRAILGHERRLAAISTRCSLRST
jgi:D-glycero-D-manno-heptose 1,7-bisphosphate phosphatase